MCSPIIFSVDNKPLYECKFVLATLLTTTAQTQANVTTATSANTSAIDINTAPTNSKRTQQTPARRSKREDNNVVQHHDDDDIASINNLASETLQDVEEMRDKSSTSQPRSPQLTRRSRAFNTDSSNDQEIEEKEVTFRHKRLSRIPNFSNGPSKIGSLSRVTETEDVCPPSVISGILGNASILDNTGAVPNSSPNGRMGVDSPPPKMMRKHFLFNRCFDSTYDPSKFDQSNVVLAPSSDPED